MNILLCTIYISYLKIDSHHKSTTELSSTVLCKIQPTLVHLSKNIYILPIRFSCKHSQISYYQTDVQLMWLPSSCGLEAA